VAALAAYQSAESSERRRRRKRRNQRRSAGGIGIWRQQLKAAAARSRKACVAARYDRQSAAG